MENLLRLGYAIRLIDETAVADPMYKDGSTPGAADTVSDEAVRTLQRGIALGVLAAEDLPEANRLSIDRDDGPPPAEPIDIQQWLNDTSGVCTHDFEPYAEHVLELITLDRLGVLPLMDALMGERPADGAVGDDVVAAVSNARFGYALRNRETQLLGRPDHVATDDAIATLLEERWGHSATVDTLVIAGVLRDIITFGFLGGSENLYAATPGTTPEVRRRAIKRWADRHFPGDSKVTGRNITIELVEYGYALHRLFEIHPDALDEPE